MQCSYFQEAFAPLAAVLWDLHVVFLTQDKHVLFELTLSLLAGVISGLHQLLELCRHGDGNLQEGRQKSVSKT